jgi:hypothetical protein
MSIQLILKNDDLSEDRLQALTQDLSQTLTRETDIHAELAHGDSLQGSKGDPITIGVLALVFLKGGSALALIEVLKSYLMRNSSLEIHVKSGDKVVKINGQNIQAQQVEQVINSINQLFIDSEPR